MFLFFIFEVTFLSVFVILIYVHSFLQHMGLKTFSVKDQIVNVFGFWGHIVSILKKALDNKVKECVWLDLALRQEFADP